MVHHQLCKYEDTFHVTQEAQEEALMFHWWSGFPLVAVNAFPWAIVAASLHVYYPFFPWVWFVATFAVTFGAYYLAYEYLHLLMHRPNSMPLLEKLYFFKFIKAYHRIHHNQMGMNLNVVLPIADFLLGTFVWSKALEIPVVTPDSAKRTAKLNSRYRTAPK
ncbi:MAG: hypothetical protein KDC83_14630 [Flavobacteriales bacterium]|nr:hypothetical protein [Flavobacteriales bacterium]